MLIRSLHARTRERPAIAARCLPPRLSTRSFDRSFFDAIIRIARRHVGINLHRAPWTSGVKEIAIRDPSLREDRLQIGLVEDGHQLRDLAAEGRRDTEDGREAWHFLSSLHIADVALGQAGSGRELLLRDSVLLAKLPQAPSKHFALCL